MHPAEASRKQRFRAALAYVAMTQAEFAAAHGVTPGHLSAVLKGARESAVLTAAIEAFIAEHLPNQEPAPNGAGY